MRAELFLDAHAQLAEGPLWDDPNQHLLWVDILAGQVHRTAADAANDTAINVGEHVGAVALTVTGRVIAAARSGFRLLGYAHDYPLLAAPPDVAGSQALRMNDGKCDPRGRFVAGTMAYDNTIGAGSLWSFDGETVSLLLSDVTISNGLAWSEDGTTFYFIDTPTHRVDAFDYDCDSGRLSNRRVEVKVPSEVGDPDGLTIDREGGLWVALWGGGAVHRYVAGRLEERVEVPARFVTSCTFGGPEWEMLYITTAQDADRPCGGAIYVAMTGCRGLAPTRFSGRSGHA